MTHDAVAHPGHDFVLDETRSQLLSRGMEREKGRLMKREGGNERGKRKRRERREMNAKKGKGRKSGRGKGGEGERDRQRERDLLDKRTNLIVIVYTRMNVKTFCKTFIKRKLFSSKMGKAIMYGMQRERRHFETEID